MGLGALDVEASGEEERVYPEAERREQRCGQARAQQAVPESCQAPGRWLRRSIISGACKRPRAVSRRGTVPAGQQAVCEAERAKQAGNSSDKNSPTLLLSSPHCLDCLLVVVARRPSIVPDRARLCIAHCTSRSAPDAGLCLRASVDPDNASFEPTNTHTRTRTSPPLREPRCG
jgi:hypothetical protein